MQRLREQQLQEEQQGGKGKKRLSSPELWEARQLINAGVLSIAEYPTFDAESGKGILDIYRILMNLKILIVIEIYTC